MKRTPFRVQTYIYACAATAAGVAYLALREDGHLALKAAVGFGVLCFMSENFSVTTPLGTTYSVSFVITIAAIVSLGPPEAIIATIFGTTTARGFRSTPPIRHLFNASQLAISSGLGGLAYLWADGPIGRGQGALPGALLPLLVCTAVNFPANTLLVSGAVGLSERRSPLKVWRAQFAGLAGTYIAFALLGLLLGILYLQMGWASVLFLLMPLLVARHAFQAAITMQGAYDATILSLMSAIETKDPYTRGHAERVGRLAEMTARAYGLSAERCRAIRYAANMHDVGKLAVLSRVLQKAGKLTDDEYEHMKTHSVRGVEIISEIDLLQEAADGVRHHHERVDGTGYPDGLKGDEIPLFARLITVADAFDSMTSTRVYRRAKTTEEALVELNRCAGVMFDEAAVEALESAIARHGWQPTDHDPTDASAEGGEHARLASIQ